MPLRSLLWSLVALLLWSTAGLAQSSPKLDYEAWSELASRVERVLEYGLAPDQTIERFRSDVAGWRERFLEAQEDRSLRIDTLQRQLEALGSIEEPAGKTEPAAPEPVPSDPTVLPEVPAQPEPSTDTREVIEEDDWIIKRRVEIKEQLRALQVPNIRAAEAFAHSDGLVRELDSLLRQRKADVVFARGPTPLNPLNWKQPLLDVDGLILSLPAEVLDKLRDDKERAIILTNLPLVFVLVVMGGFLLLRGRIWTQALRGAARSLATPVISYPLQALVVFIEIALPWFGLAMLLYAATASNLFGETGDALFQAIRLFGLYVIIGVAFVERLLPTGPDDAVFVSLDQRKTLRARRVGFWMVYTMALGHGVGVFLTQLEIAESTLNFWLFPFYIVLGFLLHRFSRLFLLDKSDEDDDDDISFSLRLLDIVARIGALTAVLSPIAAAAGFNGYAAATLLPACFTIFALGVAAFFGAWLKELYAAVKRRQVDESDLAPTLIGIAVYTALIPVLALIWGARVTDLTEVWNRLREGFSLGGVTVSPLDIVTFILVFAVLYGLTRLLQAALRVSILPKTRLDVGSRTAVVSGIGYIGVFLAGLVAIRSTGLDLSSLAIVAGALSVGIGFGLQTIVSNFVSGIILLIERPISEGDWIDVNGQQGYVRSISVRSTRIETFDRTDVIVPNSDLISGTVTNWTRGNLVGRVIVPVGVAYGTDPVRVERILREIAEDHPMVLIAPPPAVLFMGFGADALDFEIRAILRDVNFSMSVRSDLNHAIAKRFVAENIEIPFAQRDLWLRNPETLDFAVNRAEHKPLAQAVAAEMRQPRPMRDDVPDAESGDQDGDAR